MSGEGIHSKYNPQYNLANMVSSFGANYGISPHLGKIGASISKIANFGSGYTQGNIGDIFDGRRQAMLAQMSYSGQLNPGQTARYDDATKAKALGNFAELTDAQMEAAVMKNWEQRVNGFIQIA